MPDQPPPRVSLAPRGLLLGDRPTPLLSGSMAYYRVPPRHWAAGLRAIRGLGFPLVETYVPWGVHEQAPGRCRFDGDLDLGAFLDAAAAEGLGVLLRPGPHVNAELTWFGFPERVLADPRVQARTGRGTPAIVPVPPRTFPAPSYSSRAFLDEVRRWYAAVAEVVRPRLWPAGPVVAIQVDNEQGHLFRSGAFDGDYHEDALRKWAEASGGAPAPRRFAAQRPEDLALHLRWAAFRERLLTDALADLSAMLGDLGLGGVPRYHNFPPVEPTGYDLAAAESVVDFAGIDVYHSRRQYGRIRRRALYLAGTSRLPYVPETAGGSFPWGPPFEERDSLTMILGALMHGVAGYNLYMAVDRDRWYGAPISPAGEPRPGLGPKLARLHAALQQAGWMGLRRPAPIGVIVPRDYARLAAAASLLGPVGPMIGEMLGLGEEETLREDGFGLAGPVQLEQLRWREAILGALDALHLPYVIVDQSSPPERLAACRALVVPTFDFLDEGFAARLRAWAAAGGRLLHGPRAPSLNAAMQQAAIDLPGERLDPAMVVDADALRRTLARLLDEPPAAAADRPEVDTALHVDADGSPALLFVGNRGDRPLAAAVDLGRSAALEDVLDGTQLVGQAPSVTLEPFQVRLFRLS